MRRSVLIKTIVLLNVLVFLGWHGSSYISPTAEKWMIDNFLVSWSALEDGRFWTLATSVFSQLSTFHLLINMYVLWGFGIILNHMMGTKLFLNFYMMAGITGSFMHSLVSMLFLHNPDLPALGASGAIAGIIILFSLTFPQEKLLLFGIIPVRAKWACLLIVGIDLWGLFEQSRGGGFPIGHGAHLGGALMGVIWFFWMKKKGQSQTAP